MRISKKRIRSLESNLIGITSGAEIVLVAPLAELTSDHITKMGFSANPQVGERVLPAILGPISRFNAEGAFIKHRDQPMETCYRQHEWRYQQWHGKDTVEVTKIVDVPYQRYPRTPIPPPSIELSIVVLPSGETAITTIGAITVDFADPFKLRHSINLMLELFGFCDVIGNDLLPIGVIPVISLNWRVLPPGEMQWSKLEPHLKGILDIQRKGTRPIVEHRLKELNRYEPTFVAVGQGGFTGYIIFGFPSANMYVLECARYGNATYVLEGNWRELSRLTKSEILKEEQHKVRIIHKAKWEHHICALFRDNKEAA